MSKYIDKKDALKEAKAWSMFGKNDLVSRLERLPSIDIVYCKYCKWRGKPGCALEINDESDKPGDYDFCSFGQKEVLLDPHNCAGCKYEDWWSPKCEKCSRHLVDEYVRKEEAGDD